MQTGAKFTPVPVYQKPNGLKPKGNKVVVDDLPFPNPHVLYNTKWQKGFCPTLLAWASTFQDPYTTNTLLNEEICVTGVGSNIS
jgi:hypothetical protein